MCRINLCTVDFFNLYLNIPITVAELPINDRTVITDSTIVRTNLSFVNLGSVIRTTTIVVSLLMLVVISWKSSVKKLSETSAAVVRSVYSSPAAALKLTKRAVMITRKRPKDITDEVRFSSVGFIFFKEVFHIWTLFSLECVFLEIYCYFELCF